MDSGNWVSPRESPLSGDALRCGSYRLGDGYRWRRCDYRDCHGRRWVALKDERAKLGGVSPDKRAIGQEPALILKPHAGELSIWGNAEDDVAGVVGVFDEGGVGIFAAEAG